MKNVLELGCIYDSTLKNIKIQYYAVDLIKLTGLYQTIYYGKIGRDKVLNLILMSSRLDPCVKLASKIFFVNDVFGSDE